MLCLYCEKQDTLVIDSRELEEGKAIRRRRECPFCKKRFTTYERPELKEMIVIKRNGAREEYKRDKIEKGVQIALEKRPIDFKKVEELVDDIEIKIFNKNKKEIKSKEIGLLVLGELKKVDEVACLRFLSVYRSFGSLDSFDKAIRDLKDKK